MKNFIGLIFKSICAGFSALLLIASLLGYIELAAINEKLASTETEIKALKEEYQILQARYENSLSLSELEQYAINELGMQRLSPGQIIYLEIEQ